MKNKFPLLPPTSKLKATWIDGDKIMALAVDKTHKKVFIYEWDGIAELYNKYYIFDQYKSS